MPPATFVSLDDARIAPGALSFLVVGETATGKSALVDFFVRDARFNSAHHPTTQVEVVRGQVPVQHRGPQYAPVEVDFYDAPGDAGKLVYVRPHYDTVDALVLAFDLTNAASFQRLRDVWWADVEAGRAYARGIPLLVLGLKAEDPTEREVGRGEVNDFVDAMGLLYAECSVEMGQGVIKALAPLMDTLLGPPTRPVTPEDEEGVDGEEEEVEEDDEDRILSVIPETGVQPSIEPVLTHGVFVHSYKGDLLDQESHRYQGNGEIQFKDDHVYRGELKEGHMHGKGVYKWAGGASFEGEFKESVVEGTGTYLWADDCHYVGEVSRGMRHGSGDFTCSTIPSRYEGQWQHGQRHGQGKMTYDINGKVTYEGTWVAGMQHGYGEMQYQSGSVYKGEWVEGRKEGQGEMHWMPSDEKYVGGWLGNKPHGLGEHVWYEAANDVTLFPCLNRYVGEFSNGLRHGKGTFYYASGAKYEGEWQHNLKQGTGRLVYANGFVYEGLFERDRIAGEFKVPTAAPNEPAERAVVLPIDDLLDEYYGDDVEAKDLAREQIAKYVVQNVTELNKAYAQYAVLRAGKDVVERTMDLYEFHHFLLDNHIAAHTCNLIHMDFVVVTTPRSDLVGTAAELNIHDDRQTLLVRQFVESLIRVACIRYEHMEGGLDVRVKTMFDHCFGDREPFAQEVQSVPAQKLIHEYNEQLHEVYHAYAQHPPRPRDPNSDGLLNVQEFLCFLRDQGALEHTLTTDAVLEYARDHFGNAAFPEDTEEEDMVFEEMSFAEFVLFICAAAEARFPEQDQRFQSKLGGFLKILFAPDTAAR